jgi:hypothetical protein
MSLQGIQVMMKHTDLGTRIHVFLSKAGDTADARK